MFECTDVSIERSGQRVIENLSLRLKAGDFIGLVGPNGCGKTTLLEALAGVIPLATGSISLDGKPLENTPAHARARCGIRLIPDRDMVFANLSVREHLSLQSNGADVRPEISEFASFRLDQAAGSLSGGEKRILATVSALRSRPRLLLADEFSEGLQYSVVQKTLRYVRELCHQGAIAILVVHSERFAADEGLPPFMIERKRLVPLA